MVMEGEVTAERALGVTDMVEVEKATEVEAMDMVVVKRSWRGWLRSQLSLIHI